MPTEDLSKTLRPIRRQLFVDNEITPALESLTALVSTADSAQEWEQVLFFETLGYAHLALSQWEPSGEAFLKAKNYYMHGYTYLLAGDLDKASRSWQSLMPYRNNHWCRSLYGLVTRNLQTYPTFFQIRNNLEGDVINLFRSGQLVMASNLISFTPLMAEVNYEAYKFVGRALMFVGMLKEAERFLLLGQKILPSDPEIYFHLGQYYYHSQRVDEAITLLRQCNLMTKGYVPAQDLLTEIGADAE